MAKVEMGNMQHITVEFDPAHGDYRQVVIDSKNDVRICDGRTVVKIRFEEQKVKDVLQDDQFMSPYPPPTHVIKMPEQATRMLVAIERDLSHLVSDIAEVTEKGYLGVESTAQRLVKSRDALRKVLREADYKGSF